MLASLPLPDLPAALAETRYAFEDLGVDGITLLTSYSGRHLGDPHYEPLMAELDRFSVVVLLHPASPPLLGGNHRGATATDVGVPVGEHTRGGQPGPEGRPPAVPGHPLRRPARGRRASGPRRPDRGTRLRGRGPARRGAATPAVSSCSCAFVYLPQRQRCVHDYSHDVRIM
ncbi:amidohydrolase family protein [Streptomyces cellulosae]